MGGEKMPNDFDRLSACLSYDPETGIFRWKTDCRRGMLGEVAGFPAGGGYTYIKHEGRHYRANRTAWLLMTGSFPPKGKVVDHRNGILNDDRWENLRLATKSQNGMNRAAANRNNSGGVLGVSLNKRYGKWSARIMVDRKPIMLGFFDSIEAAAAARKAAEEQYFGEFARKAA